MFIVNPSTLSNTVIASKRLGEYLIKYHKIPVLSKNKDDYIFSDTPEFKKVYESLPWYVKMFYK